MGAQHDPGPWRVVTQKTNFSVVADTVVARLSISPQSQHAERGLANARLIAAAPDLLEAARECLPLNIALNNPNVPDTTIIPMDATMGELRRLAAAIAKAGG